MFGEHQKATENWRTYLANTKTPQKLANIFGEHQNATKIGESTSRNKVRAYILAIKKKIARRAAPNFEKTLSHT